MGTQVDQASLGEHIERLVVASGRKRTEVCRDLGVSARTLDRWITGQTLPYDHNLTRIADVFGIDRAEVFGWAGKAYTPAANEADVRRELIKAELDDMEDRLRGILEHVSRLRRIVR